MNVLVAFVPPLGLVIGYLSFWTLRAVARIRHRCPRGASWDVRVARLRRAVTGTEPRWLETDEIGLDPATIERLCADHGWRVVRAYPLSNWSWLQFVVPPGHDGYLPAVKPAVSKRGIWELRQRYVIALAGGVLIAFAVVNANQLETYAVALGLILAIGIPAACRSTYWCRSRQMEWLIQRFHGREVRYGISSTTIPRGTVRYLAADLGYRFRRTEWESAGRADVFARCEL